MQESMKGKSVIYVKDPYCKRSKRAINENNYQHGSKEIHSLRVARRSMQEIQ